MELLRCSELSQQGRAYVEFLRTQHLSAGIYRLPVGAPDNQQPHGQDEIYYVIAGIASFRAGQRNVSVAPGDILFVPANEPHDFHEITEDLELLVFFAPPEG